MSVENQKRERSVLSMHDGTQRMDRWRLFRQRNPCSINVGLSCSCIVGVLHRILIAPLRSSSSSFLLCAAALIIVFAPPRSSSFLRRRALHHFCAASLIIFIVAPVARSSSFAHRASPHEYFLSHPARAHFTPHPNFIFIARRRGRVDCCAIALS